MIGISQRSSYKELRSSVTSTWCSSLISEHCTSLSVSNSSSLGALVLSATPQTDESSFKEERINYLSVSALSSSVCTSLLTLSNLFCWLCALQTDAAAPRCEAGWRVEGGGVAAGNERQIHQTKEVWEFKRQKERDLWRTWREIRCHTERQISDVLTGSEQTDAAFLSRHRHLQPADGGGVVYSGSIWTQMFSKTCRERGEKILFGYVWTHPEAAGSDNIPGHVPTNMSQSASWMLLMTFSTCYSHRTLFPPAASRHHQHQHASLFIRGCQIHCLPLILCTTWTTTKTVCWNRPTSLNDNSYIPTLFNINIASVSQTRYKLNWGQEHGNTLWKHRRLAFTSRL